jgi:flavin-dependent dehydrogenase
METTTIDVLVIGAGPAGSVAASIINKSGLKVRMVEKEKFPRFVIGESLLPLKSKVFNKNLEQNFYAEAMFAILILAINLQKDGVGPGKCHVPILI